MVPTDAAVKLPPRKAWRSSRQTRAPARAAASAAPNPAGPPPATQTSTSATTSARRADKSTAGATGPKLRDGEVLGLRGRERPQRSGGTSQAGLFEDPPIKRLEE